MRKINERLGEENYNKYGTLMKIIEYIDTHNIVVEFQDEYKVRVHTEYRAFTRGGVNNPYDKTVCNIGYLGEGKYKYNQYSHIYTLWLGMIRRCYSEKFKEKRPTYKNCVTCKEWHCFQNFAEWYEKEMYNCNGEKLDLDKDILIKGNKIYSPETCMLVPQRINYLFVKSDATRGKYPIGVRLHKRDRIFEVHCSIIKDEESKSVYLGRFPLNRPFQAFTIYKNFKENYIKQVADEYKDLIPKKLYEALYKYEVEIND